MEATTTDNTTPVTPKPETPDTAPGTQDAGKTFSQDDVNRIVGERAKRAEESARNELLKSLGFESADDLAALVKDAKERKESEMSELDKLKNQLEKERNEREQLKALAEKERLARLNDKRITAIIAGAKGAADAQDVVTWAQLSASDQFSAVLDADGNIDEKAVKTVVDACRKAKPHYFSGTGPGSPSNKDGKPTRPDDKQILGDQPLFKI